VVVAASGGYPEQEPLQTGFEILGLEEGAVTRGSWCSTPAPSRTARRVVTSGGRVLAVSALGDDLAAARTSAYSAMEEISFSGMRVRSDIAEGK
jgi:phosphoribosylamine---glycine ligase